MKIFDKIKGLSFKSRQKKREQKVLKLYEQGAILQVDKDLDNKLYILDKIENGNN